MGKAVCVVAGASVGGLASQVETMRTDMDRPVHIYLGRVADGNDCWIVTTTEIDTYWEYLGDWLNNDPDYSMDDVDQVDLNLPTEELETIIILSN